MEPLAALRISDGNEDLADEDRDFIGLVSRTIHLQNETLSPEFFLLGLQDLSYFRLPIFIYFLGIFGMTLASNCVIITLVSTNQQLHSPMYFFLGHLAATDILVTICIAPYMLHVVLKEGAAISLGPCIVQLFFFCVSETVECFILMVMSYDRYLAICDPLRYNSIMSAKLQYHLMFWSWFAGTMTSISLAAQISVLQYCGSNVIDHFFCDTVALLELSCSSTYIVKVEDLIIAITVTLFPFIFICLTYLCIFFTVFKRQTHTGRQKAFSTCTSHLLVVSIFYGSLLSVYGAPSGGYSATLNKGLSLLYTFFTPLFNPIIYSLRSEEIRSALRKQINRFQN
ncbi:olfactory receptor 5P55-like [Rhinoderma darwinii]|uniref:olfactory receptor 5P55-like n=1 Tax=Rhinoderma darwinii TaxID=43563 RepID=UPI003F677C80